MVFVRNNKHNQNAKQNKNVDWFGLILFGISCLCALIYGIRLIQNVLFGFELTYVDTSIFSTFVFSFIILMVYEYIVKDD